MIYYNKNFIQNIFGTGLSTTVRFLTSNTVFNKGLHGDLLVLTSEGYFPLREITTEHLVLTENGEFKQVKKISTYNYTGTLLSLRAKYHPSRILCHPDQQFLVRTKLGANKFSEPLYKKASKLTRDDFFGMVVNTKSEIPPVFSVQKKINQFRAETVSLVLNEPEMFWLIGYFLGDGWLLHTKRKDGRSPYKIEFVINTKDESEVVNKIQQYLSISVSKDRGTSKEFQCRSILWFSILERLGRNSYGKKFPEWIQNAPISFVEAVVKGYMKADGSVDKFVRYSLRTVSTNLAFGFQRLLLKLGFFYGITLDPRTNTIGHKIKGKLIKHQRPIFTVHGVQRETQMSSFIDNNFAWFLPYEKENAQVEDFVLYFFDFEDDSFFIGENIVIKS